MKDTLVMSSLTVRKSPRVQRSNTESPTSVSVISKSINKYLNYDFLHCHRAPQWLIGVSFGFQGDRTRSQYLLDRARLIPLITFVHLSLLTRPLTHHIFFPYSKTLFQLICYPTHIFKGNAVKMVLLPVVYYPKRCGFKCV